jgi:hypothetical protein
MEIVFEQDSLGWWRARIVDVDKNSLAELAWHRAQPAAEAEAQRWIARRRAMGMDVPGGGYR